MSDTATVAQLPVPANEQQQPVPLRRPQEIRVVTDPIPVLDTGRFEHMQRVATVMAGCSMIPDALCKAKDDEGNLVWLPEKQIMANCFMVVNQSVRWGMDPFAVAQCVSRVHGKLCYEGKLIAAVINAKLGFDLEYEFEGEGDKMKVTVTAATKDGKPIVDSKGNPKAIEGTVAEWQTTGKGSPWSAPGGKRRMLRYRGAREWCRVYSPALMLGVYSDDEMEAMYDYEDRRSRMRDVTPAQDVPALPHKAPPPPPPPGAAAEEAEVVESSATAPEPEAEPEAAGEASPPEEAPTSADAETQETMRKAPPPPPAAAQPETEQAAEPTVDPTAEAPDAAADPVAFMAWADAKLSKVPDGFAEAYGILIENEIEPAAANLFPGDRDKLDAVYRKHEPRFN